MLTNFLRWVIEDLKVDWVYPRRYRNGGEPVPLQWVLLEAAALYLIFLALTAFLRMSIHVIPKVHWEWI